MDKTCPIGTKIKYIGSCKKCRGQIGKIIEVWDGGCYIVLPQSLCVGAGRDKRVCCNWSDIMQVSVKNQQLVFDFVY